MTRISIGGFLGNSASISFARGKNKCVKISSVGPSVSGGDTVVDVGGVEVPSGDTVVVGPGVPAGDIHALACSPDAWT